MTLLLLALATVLWPPGVPARMAASARERAPVRRPGLGALGSIAPPDRVLRWTRGSSKVVSGAGIAVATGILGAIAAGIAGLVAAGLGAVTLLVLIDSATTDRRMRCEMADLIAGLRLLSRDLRSGAVPAVAATHAAGAARGVAVAVLTELATGARVGAPGGSTAVFTVEGPTAEICARLTSGWDLAARQGLAITPIIDAVVLDASERLAADTERAGQVAGPRISGYVMAALPAMGLLLGVGMGADPIRVLTRTGIGNVLLAVGVTLTCAGLLWSARIIRR